MKSEKRMNCKSAPKTMKKRIIIDTPCSVPDVEAFLHIVSHEGHWHDAVVRGEKGNIVIEFDDDSQTPSVSKARRS